MINWQSGFSVSQYVPIPHTLFAVRNLIVAQGGMVALSCLYAVVQLARAPTSKTPGSVAAYHTFAAIGDVTFTVMYAFGTLAVHHNGGSWTTMLGDPQLVDSLLPAFSCAQIGAGGLHCVSLALSLFLGVMFRRIALLPPDMKPLESQLRSGAHKRNKSSVAMSSSYADDKRYCYSTPTLTSTPTPSRPVSAHAQPPAVPAHAQYPGGSGTVACLRASPTMESAPRAQQPRAARFTEAWYASDSLVARTRQRNRAQVAEGRRGAYEALHARDGDESGDDGQEGHRGGLGSATRHPNPLRSHPSEAEFQLLTGSHGATGPAPARPRTPYYGVSEPAQRRSSVLSEVSLDDNSAIQPGAGIAGKPYGELKARARAPPMHMMHTPAGDVRGGGRQVSSGTDYYYEKKRPSVSGKGRFWRRNVSGKAAEEGRGGEQAQPSWAMS